MTGPKDNNSGHYLIIMGILGALWLLFLLLFRLEDPEADKVENEDEVKLFYMIPGEQTRDPDILEQVEKDKLDLKEIAARDSFDDPTIMSFPNKKYGFSIEFKEDNEPPKPLIEQYNLPIMNVDPPVSERTPLVGIFPDPGENDPGNFKAPSLGKIDVPDMKREYTPRIVWLEDGKEVKAPFKVEDVVKLAAGKKPLKRTEIKIEKLSTSPVLFLTGKCGVNELDRLVMTHLRSELLKVFVGDLKPSQLPDSIIVDWRLILR